MLQMLGMLSQITLCEMLGEIYISLSTTLVSPQTIMTLNYTLVTISNNKLIENSR